jgi:secretion/DNA translocation related TadE-like protein
MPPARDGGVAAALALTVVTLLGSAGAVGVAVATAVFAHTAAAVAADAAALAAAGSSLRGADSACRAAADVAAADHAALLRCVVDGAVADVTVRCPAPRWLAWAGASTLNARAGPADITEVRGST